MCLLWKCFSVRTILSSEPHIAVKIKTMLSEYFTSGKMYRLNNRGPKIELWGTPQYVDVSARQISTKTTEQESQNHFLQNIEGVFINETWLIDHLSNQMKDFLLGNSKIMMWHLGWSNVNSQWFCPQLLLLSCYTTPTQIYLNLCWVVFCENILSTKHTSGGLDFAVLIFKKIVIFMMMLKRSALTCNHVLECVCHPQLDWAHLTNVTLVNLHQLFEMSNHNLWLPAVNLKLVWLNIVLISVMVTLEAACLFVCFGHLGVFMFFLPSSRSIQVFQQPPCFSFAPFQPERVSTPCLTTCRTLHWTTQVTYTHTLA